MNKRDLNRFEKMLLAERDRLVDGYKKLGEEALYKPISDNVADLGSLAEVGTDSFDRETALNLASGEYERLEQVVEALKRIKAGTFGTCEGCGGEIPKKRLEVFPAAEYCIECKSKLERDGVL